MPDLDTLSARHAVPGRIAFEASPLGGPIVRLTRGDQQALIALQGAQVLNWTVNGEGLLWMSPVARLGTGKAVRGGIPVCWPWFADHPTDGAKPAHGFVRVRPWEVSSTRVAEEAATITFTMQTLGEDQQTWPHTAEARLTVTLGEGLDLLLETRNTGATAFELTQALHTYFRISDVANVQVLGLGGCAYLDKLDGFAKKVQTGTISIGDEVDRIYLGATAAIDLLDQGSRRVIRIASSGSRSAVVWNPWTAKTARLGDMGSPEAYRQMLCIETANAGDDVVMLAPRASHVLGARYRLGS